MGAGRWDATTYAATTTRKVSTGTTFGYTTTAHSTGIYKAHDDLDPKKVNGDDSPLAGQNVRESRDSDEHPTSVPVAVFFDETGSMGAVPRTLQQKLTTLFGTVLRKGYLEHPQIMMGAYGDGVADRSPLQVSQFESDNRIDDALDNIFLEGNGGGNMGESQWLAWYFLATHTATDAWEKRSKKGYAFFIGDEKSLEPDAAQIKKWVGDAQPLCETTDTAIVAALKEKWDPYVLVIDNGSAKRQRSVEYYTNLFGEKHVIIVQDHEAISETISLLIGLEEGVIDLDDGAADLKDAGSTGTAIEKATSSLARYRSTSGSLVTESAPSGIDSDSDDDAVTRV